MGMSNNVYSNRGIRCRQGDPAITRMLGHCAQPGARIGGGFGANTNDDITDMKAGCGRRSVGGNVGDDGSLRLREAKGEAYVGSQLLDLHADPAGMQPAILHQARDDGARAVRGATCVAPAGTAAEGGAAHATVLDGTPASCAA